MDYDFILEDRLSVIRLVNQEHNLLDNSYISLSGGLDSTIVSYLIDMALPQNNIPRVFIDTGIEYNYIRDFVYNWSKNDNRIIILKPKFPIKYVLDNFGYPFKSKQHSHNINIFQNNYKKTLELINYLESNHYLLRDYDYIFNLPKGCKTNIKYYFGIRERKKEIFTSLKVCPNILKYQFSTSFGINLSDKCCYKLKKEPIHYWQRLNRKSIAILGVKMSEGGMRSVHKGCLVFGNSSNKNQLTEFKPLNPISEDFEKWFVNKFNINICKLYLPPFNFKRTGCKGCPFAEDLQEQLSLMELYLPNERKQCEFIWKPIYDEYRKLNYRLNRKEQLKLI